MDSLSFAWISFEWEGLVCIDLTLSTVFTRFRLSLAFLSLLCLSIDVSWLSSSCTMEASLILSELSKCYTLERRDLFSSIVSTRRDFNSDIRAFFEDVTELYLPERFRSSY